MLFDLLNVHGLRRQSVRRALPAPLQQRQRVLFAQLREQRRGLLKAPLATARLVALDLETSGPRMDRDRLLSVGAIAIRGRRLCLEECCERYLRQPQVSEPGNILVHRIGGQQQLAGEDPAEALMACLEFIGPSMVVGFRAEFDQTVLARTCSQVLGIRLPHRFIDLAVVLPALVPGTGNDTLEDWLAHFGVPIPGRHQALVDAYAHGLLLLVTLERALRAGLRTTGDLTEVEKAQRWLGLRR